MILPFVGLSLFCVSLFLHSMMWRLYRKGIVAFSSILSPYFVGICIYIGLAFSPWSPFPVADYKLTTFVLLVGLSVLFSYVSYIHTLDGQTPSAVILGSFTEKKSKTYREIESLFSDETLIRQRVDELEDSSYIYTINNTYVLTKRGKMLAFFLQVYTRMFALSSRG